jgi:hypothetical protein
MSEFRYFDIETEGLDDAQHRVTFANLNGRRISLQDMDEKSLLTEIGRWLHEDHHWPVIGKNLIWDLTFIAKRGKKIGVFFNMLWWLNNCKHLDLKHVAILLNGNFRGYNRWIDRKGKPDSAMAPQWFKEGKTDMIDKYSEEEREDATQFVEWLKTYFSKIRLEDRPY